MIFDPDKMSWGHKFLNIPSIWDTINTQGENVTVAVIDTGIDSTNPDLAGKIDDKSKNFTSNDNDFTDKDGHGTNMAGIIGASGNYAVYGVAPKANLVIVKAALSENNFDFDVFANAINYAASIPEVDIVSISYAFLINDPAVEKAIQNCIDEHKIVVASIGNGRNPYKPVDLDTYPACYNIPGPKVQKLAVGSFDENGNLCNYSNWNSQLSLLAPGELIKTTGLGNSVTLSKGTSPAAAFTSGCLALLLSYLKNSNSTIDYVKMVLNSCDNANNFTVNSGYGRINLQKAIDKINES